MSLPPDDYGVTGTKVRREAKDESEAEIFAVRLEALDYEVVETPTGYRAQCPAHDGEDCNLVISESDGGKLLLDCKSAECEFREVVARVDEQEGEHSPDKARRGSKQILKAAERANRKRKANSNGAPKDDGSEERIPLGDDGKPLTTKRRVTKRYIYRNALGQEYRRRRYEWIEDGKRRKSFDWQTRTGERGWARGRNVEPALYRLEQVQRAVKDGEEVWLCEGEKDCEALERAGVVATTAGAKSDWKPNFAEVLAGAKVAVVADNDGGGGLRAAREWVADLEAAGCDVLLLRAATGKDAHDHLEAGHELDEFVPVEDESDNGTVEAGWPPQPVDFDFDADPPAPDWIVVRGVERGTVVMLSGDTGAAKSIVASSLLYAALSDEDWLGLPTHIDRVTVVDEENPERLIRARLQALGVDNRLRERFRYFSRAGVSIGDEDRTDEWLREHIEEYQPDLLIVDTLMAACSVEDSNSNDNAVRMMKCLRALANEYGVGVLVLHHERKPPVSGKGTGSGTSMLGARQWAGQSDGHMTLTVESDLIESVGGDGTDLFRTFIWRPAEKDRDGRANLPQRVVVESNKDSDGRLLAMRVVNTGPIEEGSQEDALARQIGALVQRGEAGMKRSEIANAVGRDSKDGTLQRALDAAVEASYVVKVKQGIYVAGETDAIGETDA
jgi:AAA domain